MKKRSEIFAVVIKNIFIKLDIKNIFRIKDNHLILWLFGLLLLFRASYEFIVRIIYEMKGPYTWDTPIYWAIGRGMLNGLKPYSDLFETKPPGIFLLSAFSFITTGDTWLCNLLQVFALIIMAAIPVWYVIKHLKDIENQQNKWFVGLLAVLFGLLTALYTAERSGEVQVESFGAVFLAVYAMILANSKGKWEISGFKTWGASICLLASIGMKEPFFMPALSIALIFSKNIKQFYLYFVRPLGIAGFIGILYLVIAGLITPYFSIYIPFIFGPHTSRFESPFTRGFMYQNLFNDANHFAFGMGFLILALFIFYVIFEIKKVRNQDSFYLSQYLLVKIVMVGCLTVLAVGFGGDFYNHHYVFAVPVFIAMFLYNARKYISTPNNSTQKWFISIVFIVLGISILYLPKMDYGQRIFNIKREDAIVRKEAEYVDAVLTRMNYQRYLFIGGNGPQLYGYTKHSPLGPAFMQYKEWFSKSTSFFRQSFIRSMEETPLIVFNNFQIQDLEYPVRQYIASNFVEAPWPEVSNIVRIYRRYHVYYRK